MAPQLLCALLLPEQQARAHFCALAEAQQPHPLACGAPAVVFPHGCVQGSVDHGGTGPGVDLRMFRPGAKPSAEGAPFFVDGYYVWTGLGGEWCFGKAESEAVFEFCSEDSALSAEDAGVGAAAVEAEDPG